MTDSLATTATATRAAGTIYDLGYQHYDGPRYGRWHAIRTLTSFSFKAAFGRGRGTKAQIIPLIVMLLLFLPVAVQVAIASATGNLAVINYAQYMAGVTFFLALFTAAQAPEVIVTDRQYGVLSLYLSRSLSSIDYISAKLFAFTGALICLTTGPQLLLFFGKVLASPTPWQQFTSDYQTLWPIIGGTVLAACYMSFIGLALAAFSARRSYAAASVMAFFVLMPALANIARVIITVPENKRYTTLANPFMVMQGFANWLFDVQANARPVIGPGARALRRPPQFPPLPNEYYLYVLVGTCFVALILLLLRYRRTEV